MLAYKIEEVEKIWPSIRPIFSVPQTDAEYERLVATLDNLIDAIGEDENHPLASLMDTLGTLIEAYEDRLFPEPTCQPHEMLQFLLDAHHLTPEDLTEVGPPVDVSAIICGEKSMTSDQILKLSLRFRTHPSVFIMND